MCTFFAVLLSFSQTYRKFPSLFLCTGDSVVSSWEELEGAVLVRMQKELKVTDALIDGLRTSKCLSAEDAEQVRGESEDRKRAELLLKQLPMGGEDAKECFRQFCKALEDTSQSELLVICTNPASFQGKKLSSS